MKIAAPIIATLLGPKSLVILVQIGAGKEEQAIRDPRIQLLQNGLILDLLISLHHLEKFRRCSGRR